MSQQRSGLAYHPSGPASHHGTQPSWLRRPLVIIIYDTLFVVLTCLIVIPVHLIDIYPVPKPTDETGVRIYGTPVHVRWVSRAALEDVATDRDAWPRREGADGAGEEEKGDEQGHGDDSDEVDDDDRDEVLDFVARRARWSADLVRLRQQPNCTLALADAVCQMNRKHLSPLLRLPADEEEDLPRDATEVSIPPRLIHCCIYLIAICMRIFPGNEICWSAPGRR